MKAPNFKLPSTSGIFQLSDYLGKNIILYFYPRDNTKGCSLEAIDFNNSLKAINKYNCIVVGVSKDSIEIDYSGFEIGPEFVVGYGLDYNGKYRELPYLAVLS